MLPQWIWPLFGGEYGLAINDQPITQKRIVVHVCDDCNSWMNSTFEIPARPILSDMYAGNAVTLDRRKATLLASYVTKHVLLMNLWGDGKPDPGRIWNPYFSTKDYRRFRATGRPLSGTRVYLGCVQDADDALAAAAAAAMPEAVQPPSGVRSRHMLARGSSAQATTLGHFMALWVRVPGPPGVTSSAGQDFIRRAHQAGYLDQVWPNRAQDRAWPPPRSFDVTTYDRWDKWLGYFDRRPPSP